MTPKQQADSLAIVRAHLVNCWKCNYASVATKQIQLRGWEPRPKRWGNHNAPLCEPCAKTYWGDQPPSMESRVVDVPGGPQIRRLFRAGILP